MGICVEELREYVIQPTLKQLGEWSLAAETLLLGTAAKASGLGFHLKTSDSKGIGLYQITPQQHLSIWDHYLVHNPDLASKVRGLASQREFLASPDAELATNLSYATAIAWMIYRRELEQLPRANHLRRQAQCWQQCFAPQGCVNDYIDCFRRFITPPNDAISSVNSGPYPSAA